MRWRLSHFFLFVLTKKKKTRYKQMNFLWSGSNPQRTTRSSIILSCPGSQICHWTDSFSNCTDSPQRALAELGTVMCRRPSGENDQAIAAGLLGYRLMCLGQYHRAGVHRMQQCWSALLIFNTTQSDKTSTQNHSLPLSLSLSHTVRIIDSARFPVSRPWPLCFIVLPWNVILFPSVDYYSPVL